MATINKYFVGGEMEAFYQSAPAGLTWTTAGGTYDPDFSRGAVTTSSLVGTYIPLILNSSQTDCWISIQMNHPGRFQNSNAIIQICNTNLTPIFRVQGIGGTEPQPVMQFQYWNGSSWNAVAGTAIVAPQFVLHKWDFHIKLDGSAGVLEAYMDGVPFATQSTGNSIFTSPANIAQVQFMVTGPGGISAQGPYLSEGMVFDVSTLGRRLYTLGETADGSNSQWSGAYTDINEVGTFNDSNFIQTGTINQTSTFVTSTISSTPAQQYLVSGLVVAGRILIGATGPQNMKGAVVVGGTTYDSTNNVANLLTGFGYTWSDFDENPNTGLDWTIAQINGPIETGWKSLT